MEELDAKYTLTELGNKSGEIVEAAYSGPVDITSRGKRKFVLLTADLYDRLTERGKQTAHAIDTMTEAEIDTLIAGLDTLLAETIKTMSEIGHGDVVKYSYGRQYVQGETARRKPRLHA